MERLIDNNLFHGGLYDVTQPHLVERYNRALAALGIPQTSLSSFSIDATGYSPEIAEELGDEHYLDPNQVNRRFIILSPAQANLPVVHASFSSTTDVMHEFFQANARQLQAITLKDVLFGEIDDDVFRVDNLQDVISVKRAEFQIRTGDGMISKAGHLVSLIDRFETEPDSWRDNDLLTDLIDHAKTCGDVRKTDFVPRHVRFTHDSFWTRHFNGLYVFHEDGGAIVVGRDGKTGDIEDAGPLKRYISLSSPRTVYKFLWDSGRIEALNRTWLARSGLIDRRLEQYVRRAITLTDPDQELVYLDPLWVKNWIHKNLDDLSDDGIFPFLTKLQRFTANGRESDLGNTPADLRFLAIRAKPGHPQRVLINRLISEYVPFDNIVRFMVNKEAFYEDYRTFNDNYRDYVVHSIMSTYVPDKSAFWELHFDQE